MMQIHDELVFDVQGKAGPIKELKKVSYHSNLQIQTLLHSFVQLR